MSYDHISVPDSGSRITADGEELSVPDDPIIPIIYGDGTGKDVGPAAQTVLSAAAEATGREINWMRVYAGETAREKYDGENLPDETVEAIRDHRVAIKGPLTTPVGSGFRSLNVALRQTLDLYANVRPSFYIEGVHSPMKQPEQMDMVVFRENTEDVYAGIEWEAETDDAERVREFVEEMGFDDVIHEGPVGLGVKPISEKASKRLVREAIDYAIEEGRERVTLVHKGNIMKFTEGAFRDWGYEVAREEYGDEVITEDTLWQEQDGEKPEDTIVVDDRIADNMLQQLLRRPDEYEVLAMPNLNGDYLSDAASAQVGGLGIASGANFGHARCLAEPVHGSAPKYAGQDKVNPSALILSGRLMFEYMGWYDAAEAVLDAVAAQIQSKRVTYDIDRKIEGGTRIGTSTFAEEVAERIRN